MNTSASTSRPVASGSVVPSQRTPVRSPAQRRVDTARLRRSQISHDIHHQLGAIMMLASVLTGSPDVGAHSQERARQLLGEARWLEQLQRAYEQTVPETEPAVPAAPVEPIRLDLVAEEAIGAIGLSTLTRVDLSACEVWAHADALAYWRALRNIVGNAVRAAGPEGHVQVRVFAEDGWAVTQVDDDGPGFGQIQPGFGSLGLGIVQDMVAAWGGQLQIRRGVLGGCCARVELPTASPSSER